jgi:hypothetical protein
MDAPVCNVTLGARTSDSLEERDVQVKTKRLLPMQVPMSRRRPNRLWTHKSAKYGKTTAAAFGLAPVSSMESRRCSHWSV